MISLKRTPELWVWITGLVYITLISPSLVQICFFKWVGIPFCPGCGLGRSIYYLVRGDFSLSWQYHPFAVPALLILLHRIFQLIKQHKKQIIA